MALHLLRDLAEDPYAEFERLWKLPVRQRTAAFRRLRRIEWLVFPELRTNPDGEIPDIEDRWQDNFDLYPKLITMSDADFDTECALEVLRSGDPERGR